MAWQEVSRRRRGQRTQFMRPELAALAQELRAHLLGPPRPAAPREEWTCAGCSTTNWLQRRSCRACRAQCAGVGERAGRLAPGGPGHLAQEPRLGQRLPPGSVWAPPAAAPSAPTASTPKEQAAKLEHAAGMARAAGAPDDVVAALTAQAASLRATAAGARPLGARLDAAAAKVAKTERRAQATAAAVETAMAAAAAAQADLEAARGALEDVRALAATAATEADMDPPTPRERAGSEPASGRRSRSPRGSNRPLREDGLGR